MYFPNAFKKVYVAATTSNAINLVTTGSTPALTAGQIGLYDAKTYAAISAAGASGTNQNFILVQGSYHTVDKIGPFAGGYKESVKSKTINPKYVSRFFKVTAKTPISQIVQLGWNNTSAGASTGLAFECGKTYNLRIDVKGSPALRFLDKNLYHTYSHFTGCCASNCNTGCTGDPVDPATVMLGWANQINADVYMNKFISASVVTKTTTQAGTASSGSTAVTLSASNVAIVVGQNVSGTGIAVGTTVAAISGTALTLSTNSIGAVSGTLVFSTSINSTTYTPVAYDATANSGAGNAAAVNAVTAALVISVAYVDTVFGNCTFTVTDKYDLEPLFVYLSLTDETGNPCAVYPHANTSTGLNVVEIQTPRQASGVGETVLRDYILFQSYLQDVFPDGDNIDQLRLREVVNDTALGTVSRSALYDQVCILHNVPRLYNPTSTFDNDQYLLVVNVPTGTDVSAFTTLVQNILNVAGNGITLENF